MTLPQNGTGATSKRPTEARQARGETGMSVEGAGQAAADEVFKSVEAKLLGKGGESKVMKNDLQHITTRLTDEGLVIEVFALKDTPLFEGKTDRPTPLLQNLAQVISETAQTIENGIAIGGHVQAEPVVLAHRQSWQLSAAQASIMRKLIEQTGIEATRIKRVTGHAEREPAVRNPMAIRNNRLEIVFLRD